MDKYNCDQLKNIKVPEKWIENALNVPNETQKRPLAPVMFYRFAAGIAACVVIAAAVTISLMFGINKNVDMTAPIYFEFLQIFCPIKDTDLFSPCHFLLLSEKYYLSPYYSPASIGLYKEYIPASLSSSLPKHKLPVIQQVPKL